MYVVVRVGRAALGAASALTKDEGAARAKDGGHRPGTPAAAGPPRPAHAPGGAGRGSAGWPCGWACLSGHSSGPVPLTLDLCSPLCC